MLRSHLARLVALGAAGALIGTALTAGPASAAPATISNAAPIAYTCTLPVPNAPSEPPLTFTLDNTFTVQKAVRSGKGAPAVPVSDALTFRPDALSALASLVTAAGVSTVGGTFDGGFGLYGKAYDATFPIPALQVADLTALLGTPITLKGTLPAPSSGRGAERLTAPSFVFVTFPGLQIAKLGCYDDGSAHVIGKLMLKPWKNKK